MTLNNLVIKNKINIFWGIIKLNMMNAIYKKGGKYVFDLILSLITLSLKTNELIKQLPEYKEI